MNRIAIVVLLLVASSLSALASDLLTNDSGATAYGLRVEFSEPVAITECGDVFLDVEQSGASAVHWFSGGELPEWGRHWLNWDPEGATIVAYAWFGETEIIKRESIRSTDWTSQPFILEYAPDDEVSYYRGEPRALAAAEHWGMAGHQLSGIRVVFAEDGLLVQWELASGRFANSSYVYDLRFSRPDSSDTIFFTADPNRELLQVSASGDSLQHTELSTGHDSTVIADGETLTAFVPWFDTPFGDSTRDLVAWKAYANIIFRGDGYTEYFGLPGESIYEKFLSLLAGRQKILDYAGIWNEGYRLLEFSPQDEVSFYRDEPRELDEADYWGLPGHELLGIDVAFVEEGLLVRWEIADAEFSDSEYNYDLRFTRPGSTDTVFVAAQPTRDSSHVAASGDDLAHTMLTDRVVTSHEIDGRYLTVFVPSFVTPFGDPLANLASWIAYTGINYFTPESTEYFEMPRQGTYEVMMASAKLRELEATWLEQPYVVTFLDEHVPVTCFLDGEVVPVADWPQWMEPGGNLRGVKLQFREESLLARWEGYGEEMLSDFSYSLHFHKPGGGTHLYVTANPRTGSASVAMRHGEEYYADLPLLKARILESGYAVVEVSYGELPSGDSIEDLADWSMGVHLNLAMDDRNLGYQVGGGISYNVSIASEQLRELEATWLEQPYVVTFLDEHVPVTCFLDGEVVPVADWPQWMEPGGNLRGVKLQFREESLLARWEGYGEEMLSDFSYSLHFHKPGGGTHLYVTANPRTGSASVAMRHGEEYYADLPLLKARILESGYAVVEVSYGELPSGDSIEDLADWSMGVHLNLAMDDRNLGYQVGGGISYNVSIASEQLRELEATWLEQPYVYEFALGQSPTHCRVDGEEAPLESWPQWIEPGGQLRGVKLQFLEDSVLIRWESHGQEMLSGFSYSLNFRSSRDSNTFLNISVNPHANSVSVGQSTNLLYEDLSGLVRAAVFEAGYVVVEVAYSELPSGDPLEYIDGWNASVVARYPLGLTSIDYTLGYGISYWDAIARERIRVALREISAGLEDDPYLLQFSVSDEPQLSRAGSSLTAEQETWGLPGHSLRGIKMTLVDDSLVVQWEMDEPFKLSSYSYDIRFVHPSSRDTVHVIVNPQTEELELAAASDTLGWSGIAIPSGSGMLVDGNRLTVLIPAFWTPFGVQSSALATWLAYCNIIYRGAWATDYYRMPGEAAFADLLYREEALAVIEAHSTIWGDKTRILEFSEEDEVSFYRDGPLGLENANYWGLPGHQLLGLDLAFIAEGLLVRWELADADFNESTYTYDLRLSRPDSMDTVFIAVDSSRLAPQLAASGDALPHTTIANEAGAGLLVDGRYLTAFIPSFATPFGDALAETVAWTAYVNISHRDGDSVEYFGLPGRATPSLFDWPSLPATLQYTENAVGVVLEREDLELDAEESHAWGLDGCDVSTISTAVVEDELLVEVSLHSLPSEIQFVYILRYVIDEARDCRMNIYIDPTEGIVRSMVKRDGGWTNLGVVPSSMLVRRGTIRSRIPASSLTGLISLSEIRASCVDLKIYHTGASEMFAFPGSSCQASSPLDEGATAESTEEDEGRQPSADQESDASPESFQREVDAPLGLIDDFEDGDLVSRTGSLWTSYTWDGGALSSPLFVEQRPDDWYLAIDGSGQGGVGVETSFSELDASACDEIYLVASTSMAVTIGVVVRSTDPEWPSGYRDTLAQLELPATESPTQISTPLSSFLVEEWRRASCNDCAVHLDPGRVFYIGVEVFNLQGQLRVYEIGFRAADR